jgi:hypothetical protein
LPEGCADMTGCRSRQPNESGRDSAIRIADPGTNRLSEHRGWRFSANPPSFVGPLSILHLNAPGERAVHSWNRRPAMLPDEGYMGNVRKSKPSARKSGCMC